MIIAVPFVLLSILAVAGGAGVLCCRRLSYCSLSFLVCGAALGGLYALLSLQFLAAIQIAIGVVLPVALIGACEAILPDPSSQQKSSHRKHVWSAAAGMLLAALGLWGIRDAAIGQPFTSWAPMWATPGEHVAALGMEWIARYPALFVLLGLLGLVGMASATYLLRQSEKGETNP